jgi:hypothetical protein
MLRELLSTPYYRIDHDDARRVVYVVRTALPQSIAILEDSVNEIIARAAPLRPAHVLIDIRDAPGNNDPHFEQQALVVMRRLRASFGELALLVKSAIGRLHIQRMSRESGQPLHVFTDEEEALRFLADQPLY